MYLYPFFPRTFPSYLLSLSSPSSLVHYPTPLAGPCDGDARGGRDEDEREQQPLPSHLLRALAAGVWGVGWYVGCTG